MLMVGQLTHGWQVKAPNLRTLVGRLFRLFCASCRDRLA
jgi:hypothetical protein